MWVQLTREGLLTRDDLMENTHSTLQRICHLGEVTRILIREQLRDWPVERPVKKSNSPITVAEEVWSYEDEPGGTLSDPMGVPVSSLPSIPVGATLAETLLQ